ncbi:HPr family phosphocarrier protein [Escherichia coli]
MRPAWELKEQCSQWQSEVTFINHRQNAKADAKSSLALIGTGTLFNDSCSLNISGSDEEQARRVLEEYIQVRFIDSDSVQPTQAELTAHPLPRSLSRLNPDLLYGNVLASGVGVGTLSVTKRQPRQLSGICQCARFHPGRSTAWQRLPSN